MKTFRPQPPDERPLPPGWKATPHKCARCDQGPMLDTGKGLYVWNDEVVCRGCYTALRHQWTGEERVSCLKRD